MPREFMDENGALIIKKTEEELTLERIHQKQIELSQKVDYIFRFLRRYEPVFEELLNNLEKKNKPPGT